MDQSSKNINSIYYHPYIFTSVITPFALHNHRQIEISCVLNGKIEVEIDFQKYILSPFDIMFASCGVFHSYNPLSPNAETCKIIIEPESLGSLGAFLQNHRPVNPIISSDKALSLFPDIAKRLKELEKSVYPVYFQKDYILSCCEVIGFISKLAENTEMQKCEKSSNDTYTKLIEFCCEHFSEEEFNIKYASQALKLSPVRIKKLFSENMNISFSKYISMLRLDKAKKMLRETSLSVTTVAFETGYSSVSAFNHAFNRVCKISPSNYRRHFSVQSR